MLCPCGSLVRMSTTKKLCACGCGADITGSPYKVVRGHLKNLLPEFCACGCGERLAHKSASSGYVAKYIHGHNDAYIGKSEEERRSILSPNLIKATKAREELRKTDEEWRQRESRAKSEGQKERWGKMTKCDRKEHGARSREGMSEEGLQRFQGPKPWNEKRKKEFSELIKENHASRSPQQRREVGAKISKAVKQAWKDGKLFDSGTKSWYHILPSGRRILVQSTWEAATAEVLEKTGAVFSRGRQVDLHTCTWRPDFLINGNLYLEVKGHPLAKAQFDRCQKPEIHRLEKAVALLEFCPKPDEYQTLDSLLDKANFIHVPQHLKTLYPV